MTKLLHLVLAVIIGLAFTIPSGLNQVKAYSCSPITTYFELSVDQSLACPSGLVVESTGELVLQPGSSILLGADSALQVFGLFRANGASRYPVIIGSINSKTPGGGVLIDSKALTVIDNLVIQDLLGPIQIQGQGALVNQMSLINNVNNLLELKQVNQTSLNSFNLSDLKIMNWLGEGQTLGLGVKISGEILVQIEDLTISERPYLSAPEYFYGVQVELIGGARVSLSNSKVINSCPLLLANWVSPLNWWLKPKGAGCDNTIIPTIFIPGYGTSINLKKLAQPNNREVELEGWHFLYPLTPAYQSLIQTFESAGIPIAVAYYDWRLPAQQAAEGYLRPVIEQMKAKYQVQKVNLVSHSFGGIVARAYIQGNNYQFDVVNLIQYGTPNYGAAKVYPVWEGGELPADWSVLSPLIRLYQLQLVEHRYSLPQIIRLFFPSAGELMPVYPALWRAGQVVDPQSLKFPNQLLTTLNADLTTLLERVKVVIFYSQDQSTLESLQIGEANWQKQYYPDGEVIRTLKFEESGDGTVAAQSAILPEAETIQVSGEHARLTEQALDKLIQTLYPRSVELDQPSSFQLDPIVWFSFDCPVRVTITMPNGTVFNSDQTGPIWKNQLLKHGWIGQIEVSSEMQWFVLKSEAGDYQVKIEALDDSQVRYWVDQAEIKTAALKKSQILELSYSIDTGWKTKANQKEEVINPTPTPQPTAYPSPTLAKENAQTESTLPSLSKIPPLKTVKDGIKSRKLAQITLVKESYPSLIPRKVGDAEPKQEPGQTGKPNPVILNLALIMGLVGFGYLFSEMFKLYRKWRR